ncbi:helix-turn-helix domain-containing protein [Acinetobacter radioresistens]|uniref:XRE family transcriptional regulator n=1 Tax=Acinetobacter radioresistens TaxID=40216 RepID=UPI0020046189|nr:S24 family peptidase [Acinetobacter radioresistens]MCK4088292.1 helix-turn-helix domain-containing protein [Acinetobacter radioresistens]
METLGTRLKQLRKEKKLTQQQLAEAIGVSKTSVIYWEKDENTPKHESLKALAKNLSTNVEWLLTGKKIVSQSSQELQPLSEWDETTPIEEDEIEIPFFQNFSFDCGSGAIGEALKAQSQALRISKATLRDLGIEKENAVATGASGDSMKPTIKDGDTIYLDLGRKTIKDGKIFAICHGGLFVAKRLYNLPMGGVRIVSDNTAEYPEVLLTAEERKKQEFEVIGWVWQISSIERW